MRGKIMAVFAVVVLIVGGLSYALTRATLSGLRTPVVAPRALASVTQLHLDALVLERWLTAQALAPMAREPFNAGTAPARAEGATGVANKIREAAVAEPELSAIPISLVALVDKNGKVLGRNGSALMRGDDLGAVYPDLKKAIEENTSGSDVWVNRARNEQLLASYAPIHDAEGKVIGAVAIGTALNDERLRDVSERTSGRILIAAVKNGDGLDVVAQSGGPPELIQAIGQSPAKEAALRAIGSGKVIDLGGLPHEWAAWSRTLDGYGGGERLAIISAARVRSPDLTSALFWPAIGVIALGLVLVGVGAFFLDAYISRPISEIEDGLLAIMNGRTDRRFEIEHAELGGLVFRLNSLLNQLFGVQEDETDEQGRPSTRSPAAASFGDALSVDETMASNTATAAEESADVRALRDEDEAAYYTRIFNEYIRAKTSIGDPVDHISKEAFVSRIKSSEKEMADKHGKPVRYKIELRGKEVVLLAVPLS